MGLKVYKSDLNCAQISSLLDADIQDTDKLIAELNSFITGTKQTLTGPAYDFAREEIETFIPILEQRKTYDEILEIMNLPNNKRIIIDEEKN